MGAINDSLAAAPDFLEQFVVTKVHQHAGCGTGIIRLRRGYGGRVDPGYNLVREGAKTCLQDAGRA